MATEEAAVRQALHSGEEIVFVQRGGVMAAKMDPRTGAPFPIDTFGTDVGWLAVTSDQRVIYGFFGRFGGAKLASAFGFTAWRRDARGVTFENTGFGPEDACIFVPKSVAPSTLHGYLATQFGDSP